MKYKSMAGGAPLLLYIGAFGDILVPSGALQLLKSTLQFAPGFADFFGLVKPTT
jgi:hypothetical protein